MKTLLLGKSGQLGWELQRALIPLGAVIALDCNSEQGLSGDLADLDGLRRAVRKVQPDLLLNAAYPPRPSARTTPGWIPASCAKTSACTYPHWQDGVSRMLKEVTGSHA